MEIIVFSFPHRAETRTSKIHASAWCGFLPCSKITVPQNAKSRFGQKSEFRILRKPVLRESHHSARCGSLFFLLAHFRIVRKLNFLFLNPYFAETALFSSLFAFYFFVSFWLWIAVALVSFMMLVVSVVANPIPTVAVTIFAVVIFALSIAVPIVNHGIFAKQTTTATSA